METLLAVTIEAARAAGLIKKSSLDKVIVDTTVMPKAIAHPTDSRLLEKSRQHLVRLADDHHLQLRHNYNRQAPRMAAQIGRYTHARQFKRMRKALKALRSRVGRVYREVGQLPVFIVDTMPATSPRIKVPSLAAYIEPTIGHMKTAGWLDARSRARSAMRCTPCCPARATTSG
ncbi:hypothetical protein SAMN05216344_112139 [Polaromonas sp. OV174]|nr:hypothetical protein SAMN05216344_112139 [Polaromonas sp. OV174]